MAASIRNIARLLLQRPNQLGEATIFLQASHNRPGRRRENRVDEQDVAIRRLGYQGNESMSMKDAIAVIKNETKPPA